MTRLPSIMLPKTERKHVHFWRTVERNGKWVTECESCPAVETERKRKKNHVRRKLRMTKRKMVLALDKVARREIVEGRDENFCQRCLLHNGEVNVPGYPLSVVVIQWAHVHTREYYITRWEPDNSLALCSRCHVWFDNHKVLSLDWFAKKWPERWENIKRILHCGTKTNDAWVRALWLERVGEAQG